MVRGCSRCATAIAATLTLVAPLTPSIALADVPFVGVNAGAPISGDSILFTDQLAADIASSGCRFVRINFIEGAGDWDAARLAKYDEIIQNAVNNNLVVLGLFSNETVHGSQAQWNENYDSTGMNPYIEAYAATAFMLIDRYKDDVKLFEIWNEPSCWSVDPSTEPLEPGCTYIWPRIFANMLAETYKECIAQGGPTFFNDHNLSLVSGAPFAHDIGGSFSSGRSYLHDTYTQDDIWDAFESDPDNPTGRRYPWDFLGYHFYLNQGSDVSTSELNAYFNAIRTEQTIQDDAADILVTEFGWTTQGVGADGKAANLTNSYDWMRTRDFIAGAMWYQYNCCDPNGDWGLTWGIGVYQPAWYAFAAQCDELVAPTARFRASPRAGTAPLPVTFTEASSGFIDEYAWDFGDETGSADSDPVHVYAEGGTYTVSLTVTGPGGADTETKADYIVVDPAPLPADLDRDGDVDLVDFHQFAYCYTGPDGGVPPPGCEELPAPVHAWVSADTLDDLPDAIAADDLLGGMIGAVEAGGFHEATPGGVEGGLADLTDGVEGLQVEAVLADYDQPALQVRYDFDPPRDIRHIHVFAANETDPGNGRVFQHYDLEYSVAGDLAFLPLVTGVTTGPFGRLGGVPATDPDYIGATMTRVFGPDDTPVALAVDSLRFIFWPVSNLGGVYLDVPDAYVSSVVKEIDVFTTTGSERIDSVADFDGDGDVDIDDYETFAACLTGPGTDPDNPPPIPPGCGP